MFDEAKTDLIDALQQTDTALTVAEAQSAVDGGELMSEQVVNQFATIEEHDGTQFVVTADGFDETLEVNGTTAVPQTPDEDETEDDTEAADDDPEPTESNDDPDTSETTDSDEASTEDLQQDGKDTYDLNGLDVVLDLDPLDLMVGEPTGTQKHGADVLTNGHPDVPNTTVPYFPVEISNIGRDTEDLFYRGVSLQRPIILEGEAGTGKNQLVRAAGSALNLPVHRQEFGADTTVFDVVGEKDVVDGETYYILGKAAKTAVFGGLYVADEINMATGSVTSYLHPLFEDAGKRELDLRGTGRTLHDLPVTESEIEQHGGEQAARRAKWDPSEHLGKYIHPDFYAVGTCNPLHYADTSEMNDALRSRCIVIEHPYLCDSEGDKQGREAEAKLLAVETGAEPSDVEDLVRCAAVLRQQRREDNAMRTPIGHRELRDTVEMAGPDEDFMTFAEAAQVKMVGQAQIKKDKQKIRDAIADEL